jgi:RNA-binding signal recognition particle 68
MLWSSRARSRERSDPRSAADVSVCSCQALLLTCVANGGQADPRKRLHLVRRLRKAAYWASELAQLASLKGDARTVLEAEAYASWMAGNLLLEQEIDWDGALAKFLRAMCDVCLFAFFCDSCVVFMGAS